jgi:hypothetical protein
MVQVVTKENIDDVVKNPRKYITNEEEMLLKVHGQINAGTTTISVGYDSNALVAQSAGEECGLFYVREINARTDHYHYCTEEELPATFDAVYKKNVKLERQAQELAGEDPSGKRGCTPNAFEDFLVEKNDQISFLAHQLLCAMASNVPIDDSEISDVLEWNMEHIGSVIMHAEGVLAKMGVTPCYPFFETADADDEDDSQWENGLPCPNGKDCDRADCVFARKMGGQHA